MQLLKENDPRLKAISTPWDFTIDGDPEPIVLLLGKLMMENNALGLSSPQCGTAKRIFVMGNVDKFKVCINPEIIFGHDTCRDVEGCLSFPNLWLNVTRYKEILVRYYNMKGQIVEEKLQGLEARVFQHELDHLDGILFDSKVGPASLEWAKQKRRKKSRHSFN
jgi:peptide deformylase